jgi:hypothetical protein
MKYEFIEQHKHEFAIMVMCQILGVSESGLYAWRKRPVSQRKREDALLTQEIEQVFDKHQGRYGRWQRWSACHAKAIVGTMQQWRVSSALSKKNVWETRAIPPMNKPAERSLSTLQSITTASDAMRRLDT